MPNYNHRLIKSKRSYSINEISSRLGINRKTCQRWLKNEGLKVIEKDANYLLIMGADLITFLKNKKAKRKTFLNPDEFFCIKCRKAVRARGGSETTVKTGKRIGKSNLEQFKRTGICGICGSKLNRFLRVYQQD